MDSDLIDLTEESKCEASKIGLEGVDDSKYARIDDSRYGRLDDSRYGRLDDSRYAPIEDSRYGRIDDPKYTRLNDSKYARIDDSRYAPIEDSQYIQIENSVIGLDDERVADNRNAKIDGEPFSDSRFARIEDESLVNSPCKKIDDSMLTDSPCKKKIGNSTLTNSRYARIDDDPLEDSRYAKIDDSTLADDRYARIDDPTLCDNEISVCFNDENDDVIFESSAVISSDRPLNLSSDRLLNANLSSDRPLNSAISNDRPLNRPYLSTHRVPASPKDVYRASSFSSSPPSSEPRQSADRRPFDKLHSQPNRSNSANSPVQIIDDDDDIHELDNELSILAVVTPKKMHLNCSNRSDNWSNNLSSNSPSNLLSNSPNNRSNNFPNHLSSKSPSSLLNSPNNLLSISPSHLLPNNRSSSRLSNSPASPYIPLTFDSPAFTSTVSPKATASSVNVSRLNTLKRNLVETSFNQEILITDLDDEEEELAPFDVNKRKQKRRTKQGDEERTTKQIEKQAEKQVKQVEKQAKQAEKQAEKEAKQAEKERKKAERAELNRQKAKLKEKERRLKEANRYLNLKNSYQFCTTIVAQTLVDRYLTNEDHLRNAFDTGNPERKLNVEIDRDCPLPMIRWKRVVHTRNDQPIADRSLLNLSEILSKDEVEEEQLVWVLGKEQFVKMVYQFVLDAGEASEEEPFQFDENDLDCISLTDFVCRQIAVHGKSLLFIVHGLEAYYRTLKNREHRDFLQIMNDDQASRPRRAQKPKLPVISRANVDEAILNCSLELAKNDTFVELKLKVRFQFAENQSELLHQIYCLSSSMADAPYRRWKSAQQGFDWFVDGDCKSGSVNLKELPEDAGRLWIKHLLLFDKVSLPVAKAIAQKYPYPATLRRKYDSIDEEDRESLLSQITLSNGGRSINADISRRIYKFLTETNEDEMLV